VGAAASGVAGVRGLLLHVVMSSISVPPSLPPSACGSANVV
jgi:hypothetical protein